MELPSGRSWKKRNMTEIIKKIFKRYFAMHLERIEFSLLKSHTKTSKISCVLIVFVTSMKIII